jgi:peptide methionine sulfoxide reductase MsrA
MCPCRGAPQAASSKGQLAQRDASAPRPKPIVSRIEASCAFFSAKADHQDFTA